MWEYLAIAVIVCFVVDVSGFMNSLKWGLFKLMFGWNSEYKEFRLKPFDCSLCMTFWTCFIYGLLRSGWVLSVPFIAVLLALLAENITGTLYLIRDLIGFITNKISDLLG